MHKIETKSESEGLLIIIRSVIGVNRGLEEKEQRNILGIMGEVIYKTI